MMLGELLAAKKSRRVSVRDSERCISARCIYRETVAVNLSCYGWCSAQEHRFDPAN
jgi:hypothetical protein